MLIKRIQLINFLSYYGTTNFKFDQGRNIVLGENNIGKSNLFNAFYWNLFGKIFLKGKGKLNVDMEKYLGIINKKALHEAESVNENTVEAKVVLEIDKFILDEEGVWEDIVITRSVRSSYSNNSSEWELKFSNLTLQYYSEGNSEVFTNSQEVEVKLDRMFPVELRDYIWFQGEDIDSLIDLNQGSSFQRAMKSISYYPKYEALEEYISDALDHINKEKRRKMRNEDRNNNRLHELNEKIDDQNVKKIEKVNILENTKEQRKESFEIINKLEDKLDAYSEFQQLDKEINKIEGKHKRLKQQMNDLEIEQTNLFRNKWILKGIRGDITKAQNLLNELEDKLTEGHYSVEVPHRSFLQKCLREKKCLVCEADDPETVHKINERLIKQKDALEKNDLNRKKEKTISRLFPYPEDVLTFTENIEEEMKDIDNEKAKILNEIMITSKNIKDKRLEIDELAAQYKVNIGRALEDHKSSKNKYSIHKKRYDDYGKKIEKLERDISSINDIIKEFEEVLPTLRTLNTKIIELEISKIISEIHNTISRVKTKELDKLLNMIEKVANIQFHNMTNHITTATGNILIDRGNYEIDLVDKNGDIIIISKGYETILKMCIINAIIKLNEDLSTSYPFIVDAPTSNLSPTHSNAYYKSIDFEQSIIFTKDFEEDIVDDLLNDESIKHLYALEAEGDGNMNNTFTIKKTIKSL